MERITDKQFLLTGYLEYLLDANFSPHPNHSPNKLTVSIITPRDPNKRGSQLSIYFSHDLQKVKEKLEKQGILCDTRYPIMRIAPVPLYNSYEDVWNFVLGLKEVERTLILSHP